MSHQWKPGDVAMVYLDEETEVRCTWSPNGFWVSRKGTPYDPALPARPLAVIDPEDREAVERLNRTHSWMGASAHAIDDMQQALREFVNSTPPEPTNSKACVTDRRGGAWRLLADGDWVCVDGPDVGEYLNWQGLTKRGPLTIETPDA